MNSGSHDDAILKAAIRLRPYFADDIAAIRRSAGRRRIIRRLGAVCAVLCLVGLGASFGETSVVAEGGRPRSVALPDGSRVDLDAGAAISLPLLPWRRDVRMVMGDALFDIVHDPARPFRVRMGGTTLTDLGTRFLVRAARQDAMVAVFDGRVGLSGPGDAATVLDAGSAARVTATGIAAAPMPNEDETTAWRHGRLIFRDTPLSQVASRLSRYHSTPVETEKGTAALRVSGTFRIDDPEGALHTLERALPIRVQDLDGKTILAEKNPAR